MSAAPIKMRSHSSIDRSIDFDSNKLNRMAYTLKKLKKKKLRAKKKLKLLKTKNLLCQKMVLKNIIDITKNIEFILGKASILDTVDNNLDSPKNFNQRIQAAKNIKDLYEERDKIAQRIRDHGDEGYFLLGRA